ncbi:MAG: hypothetical protein B6247_30065 [Candidatus Parabeggiatoa sp. nov. 2]|nr:MAG: hypothetical protein B6247_30065 [Beggiatoa sp. 4572_84]
MKHHNFFVEEQVIALTQPDNYHVMSNTEVKEFCSTILSLSENAKADIILFEADIENAPTQ